MPRREKPALESLESRFERIALDLERRPDAAGDPATTAATKKPPQRIKACLVMARGFEAEEADARKQCQQLLHPDEEKVFSKAQNQSKQDNFLLGRVACKVGLLQFEPNLNPRSIAIKNGVFAYPLVWGATKAPYEVSISHSGFLVVALVVEAGHPMGIDLECRSTTKHKAYQRILTPNERQLASHMNSNSLSGSSGALLHANLLWTIKEAISKTIRCGFTTPHHIWELRRIKQKTHEPIPIYQVTFQNFFQFKAYSLVGKKYLLSICLPRKTNMNPDCIKGLRL